jgi:quercetin dioxygenase-like cupin family protein
MRFGCVLERQRQDSDFMRRLVAGVDQQGRSCVVTNVEVEFGVREGRGVVAVEQLYATDGTPPRLQPVGRADKLDMGFGPGLGWMMIRWEPGSEWPPHYTDTVDLDIVLDGTIELLLDDGAHRLEAGDSVVVHGVDHAWRVGKEGCTMCVTAIGAPRA